MTTEALTQEAKEQPQTIEPSLHSMEFYEAVYNNVYVGVALISLQMEIIDLNSTLRKWNPSVDLAQHPVCYRTFNNPPRDIVCPWCPACKVMKDGKIHESTYEVAGSNRIRHMRIAALPLRNSKDEVIAIVEMVYDITEYKRAEKALRESELRYKTVLDGAGQGILVADIESKSFLFANRAIRQMLGYEEEEITRLAVSDIHPKDSLHRVMAEFEAQARREKTLAPQLPCLRKDGSVFPADVDVTLLELDGRKCMVGFFTDITERKQAEEIRMRLEEQLRQSQKMEAVGQLAGGIAHDFNNILTIIQGNASLLLDQKGISDEIAFMAKQILEGSERAAALTRQLLLFSRKQAVQLTTINLNDIMSGMTKMLQRILGEDVALQSEYAPHLPLIRGDAGMLEQVLLNLAVNARDAMPGGGRLSVETSSATFSEEYVRQNPFASPGACVCLSVTDSGCGIAPEHLPHIFEPFFTTKEVGKGTGLGLATVYGILKQHSGWIEVASKVGKGTTFRICLPAVEDSSAVREMPPHNLEVAAGNEAILVVEDETAVRCLVDKILQRCGYTVLLAESGVAALDVWKANKEKIQLLLTDMIMPEGMTGRELVWRLRAERPQLKVIYTSGYSTDFAGKGSALIEGFNYLQKPYQPLKLAQTVRSCLDRA